MILRFSSLDNYANSHISSADSFSLYNKVNGQLLSHSTVPQSSTADKYQRLHNFSSGFLSSPEICTLPCSYLRVAKSKNGRSKTSAKKFQKYSASIFRTVAFILTVFFSADSFSQIQPQQTPQVRGFQQITQGQSNSTQNYNQQQTPSQNYPMGANANDIIQQTNNQAMKMMGYNPPPTQEEIRSGMYYEIIAAGKEKRRIQLYDDINYSRYTALNNNEVPKNLKLANHNSADYIANSKYYSAALKELNAMLDGTAPMNLKRAIFIVENAFYNNSKSYELFCKKINSLVFICKQVMKQEGKNPNNQLACNETIQKLFSDTIIYNDIDGKKKTFYPLSYDFADFWGDKDYAKMFVSKLLNIKTGQCHSLPLLYLLIAYELKAEAYLVLAPNHSYIKYPVGKTLYGFECTNGRQVTDDWMVGSGFISTFAIKNQIYLAPLSLKETIAQCIVDLSEGFEARFGYDDFNSQCAKTSMQYYPNCIGAMLIVHNVNLAVCANLAKKFNFPPYENYEQYPDLNKQFNIINKLDEWIESTGYIKPSKDDYAKWLATANAEKQKRENEQPKKDLSNVIQNEK